MGWHDEDESRASAGLGAWAWAACLVAPAMPAMVLVGLAQWLDGQIWPLFPLVLYIGLFTVMVLLIRPWTVR